jgi:hypothetical protein
MNERQTAADLVRSIRPIVHRIYDSPVGNTGCRALLNEVLARVETLETEALTYPGRRYIEEKLGDLRNHASSLAGVQSDYGHSRRTHLVWCLQAIGSLTTSRTFEQKPRDLSQHED